MKKIDYFIYICLVIIALASRVPLLEKIQSHWDGPQYSIAVVRYSLEQSTPAPPGYPLYIALGKFFYLFLHDPHSAILAVSVFGSVMGAITLYFVCKNVYNKFTGIAATTIFLTGSTFYYFGITAYAYGLLTFTSAFLAFVVYRIYVKHKNDGFLLGLIFGICFGIRPQEVLQIAPLFLLGLIYLSSKEKLKVLFAFIIITLLWLIPLLMTVGFQKYFDISISFAGNAFPHTPIGQHAELMLKGFLLSFGISSVFLLYYFWKFFYNIKNCYSVNYKMIFLYILWIIPGFLFNLLIRSDHAGYQMSYLTAFTILIAYAIWQCTKKKKLFYTLVVVIIAIFNLYWFFYDRDPSFIMPYRPTSFHYSDIRKNDLKAGGKVSYIQKNFNPKTTLIVTTDTLWRPYMYYLKKYHLSALSGLDKKDIKFKYLRFDAYNWNMSEYESRNLYFEIPQNITHLVFPDDNARFWIKNNTSVTHNLPGKSSITVIYIPKKAKLVYDYYSIKIIK